MKMVVGLGNPGPRYAKTRHNIGFDVLAELARRHGDGRVRSKFQGEWVEARIGDEQVMLLCPLTYMNHSGRCVQPAGDFFKLAHEEILIVCDDLSLPVAKMRFRAKGSGGGQKGLADILQRLGDQNVPRLRIGIGSPPPGWDAADYVLGRFSAEDRESIERVLPKAADAVEDWTRQGIAFCMNHYNAG